MRATFGRLNSALSTLGLDLRRLYQAATATPYFLKSAVAYSSKAKQGPFPLQLRSVAPMLHDRFDSAGGYGQYFYGDLWAARKIFAAKPSSHLDIGSRVDGLIAHILTFMDVTVIDIRPLQDLVSGLTFIQDDATQLRGLADNSVESLSSLHVVEHFGLGRYGDPIDPDACFQAMHSLSRVLKAGGKLYFGVPIGRQRVAFNAHRIFSPRTVLDEFSDLELLSFAAVDDTNNFREGVDPGQFSRASNSLGLFEFKKRV
jgi:hypothetical protein